MNRSKYYLLVLFLFFSSTNVAFAFTCTSPSGTYSGNGNYTAYIRLNLTPQLQRGQNLIVDISRSVSCKNDAPNTNKYRDPIRLGSNSTYNGALQNIEGSVIYYGESKPLPLWGATRAVENRNGNYQPWQTVLYLKPTSAAGGIIVKSGQQIATLVLEKMDYDGYSVSQRINWNIIAANDVVIPTGGCEVTTPKNVVVNLPDYPSSPKPFGVSIRCSENKALGFSIIGNNAPGFNDVFKNSLSNGAKGVGIQILYDGKPVRNNESIPINTVGTSGANLNLSAGYALTGETIVAGSIQSIVNLTFTYL